VRSARSRREYPLRSRITRRVTGLIRLMLRTVAHGCVQFKHYGPFGLQGLASLRTRNVIKAGKTSLISGLGVRTLAL
jgi:hypothetical protein